MHHNAMLLTACQVIRNYLAKSLWKQAFVDSGYGSMHFLFA
jgi:hypothetical protein